MHKCDRWMFTSSGSPPSICQQEPVRGYWLSGHLGPTIYFCDEHAREYPQLKSEGLVDGDIFPMSPTEELLAEIHDS